MKPHPLGHVMWLNWWCNFEVINKFVPKSRMYSLCLEHCTHGQHNKKEGRMIIFICKSGSLMVLASSPGRFFANITITVVESNRNINAVGDGGNAIGPFQISKQYWKIAKDFDPSLANCQRRDVPELQRPRKWTVLNENNAGKSFNVGLYNLFYLMCMWMYSSLQEKL